MSLEITCQAPFELENGKVVCDSPLHAYQEDCVFECNDGFKQNGPRKMTCQADGMWSLKDTQISCRGIKQCSFIHFDFA